MVYSTKSAVRTNFEILPSVGGKNTPTSSTPPPTDPDAWKGITGVELTIRLAEAGDSGGVTSAVSQAPTKNAMHKTTAKDRVFMMCTSLS